MRIILGLLLSSLAFGQTQTLRVYPPEANRFVVSKTTTLAASTEKVTIQNVAQTKVVFEGVDVRCSAACTITFSQNGTSATTTVISQGTSGFVSTNGRITASSSAYSSSNVGSGVTLKVFSMEAAGTFSFDCSKLTLNGGRPGNLSVGIGSMSGDVTIQITFVEDYG